MRVGGCFFAFFHSLSLFSLLVAGCITPVYLSVVGGLCCFGFNNIISFTHKKKGNKTTSILHKKEPYLIIPIQI